MNCRYILLPALMAVAISMVGCSPSDGRIAVTGVVLCDGEPLDQANLAFVGGGGGTFATGSTDANGRFEIRAMPGVNKVSVGKFNMENAEKWADIPEEDQLAGTPEEMAEAMKNAPKPLVAQKYFNADTSGIEFTVEEGMGEVTIEVTKN